MSKIACWLCGMSMVFGWNNEKRGITKSTESERAGCENIYKLENFTLPPFIPPLHSDDFVEAAENQIL